MTGRRTALKMQPQLGDHQCHITIASAFLSCQTQNHLIILLMTKYKIIMVKFANGTKIEENL